MLYRYDIKDGPSVSDLANALWALPNRRIVMFQLNEWAVAVVDTQVAGCPASTPPLLVSKIACDKNGYLTINGFSLPQPVISTEIPLKAYYSPEKRSGWIEFDYC